MSVRASLTLSLDGFMAGPDQSREHPLGIGGGALHEWAWATRSMRALHDLDGGETGPDDDWAARSQFGIGATIMGRNMFGPVRGPWGDDPWTGWWGDDPPFHHPVFVLTHHPRPPLELDGGTTFHFVTDGIEAALARARTAAGDEDVSIGGGAETAGQYLRAGLMDEFHVAIAPVLLGDGALLFRGLAGLPAGYRVAEIEGTRRAAHFRVVRRDPAG